MVGVFGHLGCDIRVGVINVGHCHPVLHCRLGKVGECLLYTDQVIDSVAALERWLLNISGIVLGFDEVGLEGRTVFVFLCPPRPTTLRLLSCIHDNSVRDWDKLGLCDWLS